MSVIKRSWLSWIGRWLPGVIISLLAIWLLIQFSDWQELIDAFSLVNPIWLAPAIVFYLLGIGLRAFTWRVLLQNKATYGRVFITLNEGYLLNNIFPFRLGELGRALMLSQSCGLSAFFVLSTIVIERAYDLAIAAGLLLATLPFVLNIGSAQNIAITVLVIIIMGLGILFLLALYRQGVENRLQDYSSIRPFFRDKFLPRIISLLDGLAVLVRLDQFLLSIFLILVSWFFGALEIYYLMVGFGVEAQFWWIGFVLGVFSLGIALPSAPAGIGVYEVAFVGALSSFGIPSSQALAIALVAHLIHIIATGFIGVYGIFQDGETIASLYKRIVDLKILRPV